MPKTSEEIVAHIMHGHKGNIKGKLMGKRKGERGESVTQEAVENILEK